MAGVSTMTIKLTKRSIEAAKPGARDLFLWDTEVAGFGCKVTPKGRRVFILQYWAHGRARRGNLALPKRGRKAAVPRVEAHQ